MVCHVRWRTINQRFAFRSKIIKPAPKFPKEANTSNSSKCCQALVHMQCCEPFDISNFGNEAISPVLSLSLVLIQQSLLLSRHALFQQPVVYIETKRIGTKSKTTTGTGCFVYSSLHGHRRWASVKRASS